MTDQQRIRALDVVIGELPPGPRNLITDVAGVTVGHRTLDAGPIKTGVTAVVPHGGNLFRDKVFAAGHVVNGFGKSAGLIQLAELGVLETPIVLTNTLSVGTAYDAVVRHMLEQNPDIGLSTGTVNPLICECNDGYLNDIRGLHVTTDDIGAALENAGQAFALGAVGAGTGMSCLGLKGGIGSASRRVRIGAQDYTLGALVLSNFGRLPDLRVDGVPVGRRLVDMADPTDCDDGSIIVVLATDAPLTERQLGRVARRASVGIIRTGGYIDHGSGEIAIAFSTANRVPHYAEHRVLRFSAVRDDDLDSVFRAVAESVEEAILDSMFCSAPAVGRDGNWRRSLAEFSPELQDRGTPHERP